MILSNKGVLSYYLSVTLMLGDYYYIVFPFIKVLLKKPNQYNVTCVKPNGCHYFGCQSYVHVHVRAWLHPGFSIIAER